MPTTYTNRIRAAKLETGSSFNTWGTALNAQDFDIFDEAFGVVTIALTGVDITLTTANGTTDQARNMGYRFTGTGGVTVTMPSVQAVKAVVNNSNGPVTIQASVSSSVVIGAGSSVVIATNGTDTWQVASNLDAAEVSQVFSATSSTTNTIAGSGPTITFTLNETYRAFSPGMSIRAAVTADPEIYIDGYVVSYTGSGTTLVMQPTGSAGSGTYSAWTISFAQAQVGLPNQTGNAGKVLSTDGTAPFWATRVDTQTFTTSGTWTKHDYITWVLVRCWGAGGGGGSGARQGPATDTGGGCGGGGGAYTERLYLASDLAATESVTIGGGGSGGAAVTTNSTNGNAGSAGGNTTFSTGGNQLIGYGGGGGGGGANGTEIGGGGGGILSAGSGVTPGNPRTVATTTNDGRNGQFGGGWGGDGASDTNGGSSGYGGGGGASGRPSGTSVGGSSGFGGGGGGCGGQITTANAIVAPRAPGTGAGAGGAGGAASTSGAATAGTAGSAPGGGGGGGGASRNGNNSGAGAAGGNGRCIVISW